MLHKPKNEYVANLVGGDLFSKSLYYYTISDLLKTMPLQEVSESSAIEMVPMDTLLKIVLHMFSLLKNDRLKVIDQDQKKVGSITLNQLKLFLEL